MWLVRACVLGALPDASERALVPQSYPSNHYKISVIGTSVANGGGLKPEERSTKAWTSVLKSALSAVAGNVTIDVNSKNAVGPTYFLHCTARFLDPAATAVIIDVGPSLFTQREDEALDALALKVSKLAPAAKVLLLGWPQNGSRNENHTVASVRRAASTAHATAVVLPTANLTYADAVHPDAAGHAAVAAALCDALVANGLGHPLAQEGIRSYLPGGVNYKARPPAETVAMPAEEQEQEEQCLSARELPVRSAAGWKLVDEGVGGVAKEGWRSAELPMRAAGSEQRSVAAAQVSTAPAGGTKQHRSLAPAEAPIAPLSIAMPLSASSQCGHIAHLSFLRTVRPAAFSLGCEGGCECEQTRGFWSHTINPFPKVNATQHHVDGVPDMKVTMSTSFSVLRTPQTPSASADRDRGGARARSGSGAGARSSSTAECMLRVTPEQGTVRIDGLFVNPASSADVENAANPSGQSAAHKRFAEGALSKMCGAGAQRH